MPICKICGGYYLRPPCPVCSLGKDESTKSEKKEVVKTESLSEFSLDQQLRSSISDSNKEREVIEKQLIDDKLEIEDNINRVSSNLENVRAKVDDLKKELENKNIKLKSMIQDKEDLENKIEPKTSTLNALKEEHEQLLLTVNEKETTLSALKKELDTYTD